VSVPFEYQLGDPIIYCRRKLSLIDDEICWRRGDTMGQFDGRHLSPVRLVILGVLVVGVVFASLRGWNWFQENRALASVTAPGFAGYVDVTATPQLPFEDPENKASRDAVLAFVVATPGHACEPSWGAAYSLDEAAEQLDLDRRIARLQQNGGAAIVSFGGQANTELALSCTSAAALYGAYHDVVTRYHLTAIDIDIEGAALNDIAATQRRAAAIAKLQRADGVEVWLTLPVARTGLTAAGEQMVAATLAGGVRLAGVNVMTMDFGDLPSNETMSEAAEQALNAAHAQVRSLFRAAGEKLTSVEAWQHLGATVMIGQNDVAGEIFGLLDAQRVHDFAAQHRLGRVSLWSLNRDRACSGNYPDVTIVSDACSGVKQNAGAFAEALGGAGRVAPMASHRASPSGDPRVTPSDDPATSPYPIWQTDQVYVAGARVVWHHNVYVAKWWTSGDVPDNPLRSGDATPWTLIGPVLPGESPLPSPTVPAGTYPEWKINKIYTAGDRVMFEGRAFVAQWWTQGDSPSTPGTASAPSPWLPLTEQQILQAIGDSSAPASAVPPQEP
jgi:chitinase